jgi:DNA-binding MarR family transcriptional regulator
MTKEKKATVSPLQAHIGFWMRLVSNSVSQAFAKKLESTGVTVAEWVVMREMYGEAGLTSPSQVAELTSLSRGAVSKLLERLLQKGYIGRSESTTDRRYQDIRLTAEARDLVPQLAAIADENDETFFEPLTESERKQLTKILKKLARAHGLTNAPIE